jgi:hypothetical protein
LPCRRRQPCLAQQVRNLEGKLPDGARLAFKAWAIAAYRSVLYAFEHAVLKERATHN